MKRKFSNIVSLGSFCSVAMELEKKGLRGASYPFDWLISDSFECVISEIENGFGDFLNLEFLNLRESVLVRSSDCRCSRDKG